MPGRDGTGPLGEGPGTGWGRGGCRGGRRGLGWRGRGKGWGWRRRDLSTRSTVGNKTVREEIDEIKEELASIKDNLKR